MCMICVQYEAEKLTAEEAFRNLDEMIRFGGMDEDHGAEVLGYILKSEMDKIMPSTVEFDEYEDLDYELDDLFV